jgi:hypothetical protein
MYDVYYIPYTQYLLLINRKTTYMKQGEKYPTKERRIKQIKGRYRIERKPIHPT